MPIFPPIMLCSYAQLLPCYSFPAATYAHLRSSNSHQKLTHATIFVAFGSEIDGSLQSGRTDLFFVCACTGHIPMLRQGCHNPLCNNLVNLVNSAQYFQPPPPPPPPPPPLPCSALMITIFTIGSYSYECSQAFQKPKRLSKTNQVRLVLGS